MASSSGKMKLRERVQEDKNKQRSGLKADEKSKDGTGAKKQSKKGETKTAAKYTSRGIHKETLKDLCDCLEEDCPGCYMPCSNCKSKKCGHECRRRRRYMYDEFEIEGTDIKIENKFRTDDDDDED